MNLKENWNQSEEMLGKIWMLRGLKGRELQHATVCGCVCKRQVGTW